MRILRVLPLVLAIVLVWALNHQFSASVPAMGKLLDPVNGAMAAAEPSGEDWNRRMQLNDLQAPVEVWLDTSLIPHVRAGNDHDLYYTQGYVHASFRLWQMDLQTRAAWGRVSEVAGPKAIEFDRGMRREGMVWGAQHSLETMEKDPRTKAMLDAYRDGINAYVRSLNFRSLPIEYKLMGFEPEDWTNLRTALLMKYMARDLTGKTDDFAFTQLRDQLGQQEFDFLFPERIKGSKPVIPEGTKFDPPSLKKPEVPNGDIWTHFGASAHSNRSPDRDSRQAIAGVQSTNTDAHSEVAVGSNNWAISGEHTASGKPILCNDPHLALNLPSLWFEMQLTAPGINCYGASLPGAPGIVIGFNEKISWGFTNNYRDVKDFYEIIPTSMTYTQTENVSGLKAVGKVVRGDTTTDYSAPEWHRPYTYHFSGKKLSFERKAELIKVKGAPDVIDTVLYTIHGPVTYDPSFPVEPGRNAPGGGAFKGDAFNKLFACTWMAHRGSNELLATYLLNRAGDYPAFTNAISHFECPAQNIAYADGAGNIAMWGQGRFINKWKDQGKYLMKGLDSSTLWGESIPMAENPHVLNPPQGYVASANQQVTDSTYPYWYNGSFVEWRSWEINRMLSDLHFAGTQLRAEPVKTHRYGSDSFFALPYPGLYMDEMQRDVFSLLQQQLHPLMYSYNISANNGSIDEERLTATGDMVTFKQVYWFQLYKNIWRDDFPDATKWPSTERTVALLLSDSSSEYYDDRRTGQRETLSDILQRTFKETADSLDRIVQGSTSRRVPMQTSTDSKRNESTTQRFNDSSLQWYRVKNTSLTHLAKLPAFSYDHLKIGGWSNTINAVTGNHGPSWRMIVEMDSIPRAYAIYPGGQSGNPGSRHYGDFINQWVEGKYHEIQFLTASVTKNPLAYTWTISPK